MRIVLVLRLSAKGFVGVDYQRMEHGLSGKTTLAESKKYRLEAVQKRITRFVL
jgi:hypothetical protein